MLRIKLAAMLLRSTGAKVEFGVRRVSDKLVRGKGRTYLATESLAEAQNKYASMRVAYTDTITLTVAAVIAERISEESTNDDSR